MIPPIILDSGEVIRVADPYLRAPSMLELHRLYHRGRTMIAAVTLRPAPFETDGRQHAPRPQRGIVATWRRVTGRP
jgi:hypothetical protein